MTGDGKVAGKCESADIVVAKLEDLPQLNRVIEQAVMAWPLSERLRRLSLPLLTYRQTTSDSGGSNRCLGSKCWFGNGAR